MQQLFAAIESSSLRWAREVSMSSLLRVMLFTLIAGIVPVQAASNKVSARLQLCLHESDGMYREPVADVSLKDGLIYVVVEALNVPLDMHDIGMTIYDSQGREVFSGSRRQRSTTSNVGIAVGYHFLGEDPPGTWWVTSTLDGQPLTELQFQVKAGNK